NYADYGLLQAFVDTNTKLYLPDGAIDFSTKSGKLLGLMRGGMAGLEKQEFKERSLAAREEMRRQGKLASAPFTLPFGIGYEKPLISEQVFQRAKAILDAKAKSHYRNREGYTPAWVHFVYKGFLFCDLCEAPHYTSSSKDRDGKRRDYYVCRNRLCRTKESKQ